MVWGYCLRRIAPALDSQQVALKQSFAAAIVGQLSVSPSHAFRSRLCPSSVIKFNLRLRSSGSQRSLQRSVRNKKGGSACHIQRSLSKSEFSVHLRWFSGPLRYPTCKSWVVACRQKLQAAFSASCSNIHCLSGTSNRGQIKSLHQYPTPKVNLGFPPFPEAGFGAAN